MAKGVGEGKASNSNFFRHNTHHYTRFFEEIQKRIKNGTFDNYFESFCKLILKEQK